MAQEVERTGCGIGYNADSVPCSAENTLLSKLHTVAVIEGIKLSTAADGYKNRRIASNRCGYIISNDDAILFAVVITASGDVDYQVAAGKGYTIRIDPPAAFSAYIF